MIPSLKDSRTVKHFETKHMVNIMKAFNQNLYSPECYNSTGDRVRFSYRVKLSTLTDESRGVLCRPVTEEEVLETIRSLPGSEAPGPDDFCPDFYKKWLNWWY